MSGWSDLPSHLLELILARAAFPDRLGAVSVCRAWHDHLSQPGPLWEVLSLPSRNQDIGPGTALTPAGVQQMQRWLQRQGGHLRQLQCGVACRMQGDTEGNAVLTALLFALGITAPQLQASRLDGMAAQVLRSDSLACIASLGGSLLQLALLGITMDAVPFQALSRLMRNLPHLKDLALSFGLPDGWLLFDQPDVLVLLASAAACCPRLRTFALAGQVKTEEAQPATAFRDVTQLTVLTSLALHNTAAPRSGVLQPMTQLRQLSLVRSAEAEGRPRDFGYGGDATPLRLEALANLDTLQVGVRVWPASLPCSLTKLVLLATRHMLVNGSDYQQGFAAFVTGRLAPLTALRHLALHRVRGLQSALPQLCAAAAGMPHLRSLHLVAI